jgi:hypothetical protein
MEKFDNKEAFKAWVKRNTETQEERDARIKNYWLTLKPFKDVKDIPTLPRVDEKEWKEFYVPKLIELGAIPKKDLVVGEYYIGDHRCTRIAKWNGNVFEYWKWEFFPMEDECNHFEDDDGFALFVPIGIGTKEDFDKRGYKAWLEEKEKKKNENI